MTAVARTVAWTIRGGRVLGPAPFLVCGIVNATPDSFYDGGAHDAPAAAVAHGQKLLAEGAHVLDIGGESTRPGAENVPAEAELARVLPVVQGLTASAPGAVLSIDTTKAAVAAACLEAGAAIVNDVSACRFDPALTDVLVDQKPGYVLMHAQGEPRTMQANPRYGDVIDDLRAFFERHLSRLTAAGLPEDRVVLDPGIGFGKTLEHNLTIFRRIEELQTLGRPLYMGLSNKSWLSGLLGLAPGDRPESTRIATAILQTRNVRIHRLHEVAPAIQAFRLAEAMRG